MAFKLIVVAALVASVSASNFGYLGNSDYSAYSAGHLGGYSFSGLSGYSSLPYSNFDSPLSYSANAFSGYSSLPVASTYNFPLRSHGYNAPLTYSAPAYTQARIAHAAPVVHQTYSAPQVYSTPITKTIRHEPDVSEYSTHIETAPAIHKTRISHPPPIVHESYSAPIVHKTLVPAPVAPIAPVVKTIAHEPTISEYSTYTASAPAFAKTNVIPQAPVVHESYSAPVVHKTVEPIAPIPSVVKTVAHEPTISEFSTYTASAPAFAKTNVIPQPPVVHESYSAPVVHKTLEQAPVVQRYAPAPYAAPRDYAPRAW